MILRLLSILPFAWQLPLSEIKCASLRISILLPMIAAKKLCKQRGLISFANHMLFSANCSQRHLMGFSINS
jgi:hypothetical protein